MRPATRSRPHQGRRWSLHSAVTLGVLLLFALGAAAPAWGAGAKDPQKVIFDPYATPSWVRTFHGPGASHDAAEDVAMAKGGVTYVAGTIGDGFGSRASLMKMVDGVPSWAAPKTYVGPNGGANTAEKMALGPGNTIYTAGVSTGSNGMPDILVIKWSSSGAVKWAKRYDGPSHGADRSTAIVVDSRGNVTIGGYSANSSGADWVVVSWSSSGAKRWTSRYSASALHEIVPLGLVVAGDRSVYASGVSAVTGSVAAMTVKYSRSGKKLWKKTYKGPAGLGALTFAAVARPGGGVYVCGMAISATTSSDGLVMSYTSKGTRRVFALDTGPGGTSEQSLRDLAVTS
ncbi:MAG TPA: hypothetical protein VFH61_12730, partial [Thermoleophilia bacterium]|nr:hypothetical protein [Thermoleophilia bacterium]